MAHKTYKMPTVQQFLLKKKISDKHEPPWIYLEREMKQNVDIKPYNEKVGEWLRFLKDLKSFFRREAAKTYRNLTRGVGPSWYTELSTYQHKVLNGLKDSIHQDLIEGLPVRTAHSLEDLGITASINRNTLMKAMEYSVEDPGLFVWDLYTLLYKQSPSILRPTYDVDARILMSCLVFIDLDECLKALNVLTKAAPKIIEIPPKKKRKEPKPRIRYDEYLKREKVKPYMSSAFSRKTGHVKPDPVGYKFKLRSEESYEKLCRDPTFLKRRIERNQKTKMVERVCHYKFWEPPSTLRNTDPKMAAYVQALKTMKKRARPKHKSQFKNLQYFVGGVAFCQGSPYFIINNVSILPTGYIPIHGGNVQLNGAQCITNIHGYWKYPRDTKEKCDDTCDCIATWESVIMDYVKKSKCLCGHLYDFKHEGRSKEKYFYPNTRHGSFWVDYAKIFQMDPTEDFIKDTVAEALRSVDITPQPSRPTIEASGMKTKELLAAFLADLSDTPLTIPHLPQANLLNNIQEWVRHRVHGEVIPKEHGQHTWLSGRKWVDLKHFDFKALAYMIPFTQKQLHNMNWSHRKLIQTLFHILLNDFQIRNRLKQLEQSRLWWSTMKYDVYPSQPFLDIFYTYMPARLKDTFVINPYSSELTPKFGAKTCPL